MSMGKLMMVFGLACSLNALAGSSGKSGPEPVQSNHIEALFQVAPKVFSGGEPRGAEAFSQLAALGVKTVISVDGALPDLESAHAAGIRYIHIPLGYDRWTMTSQWRLLAAARSAVPGGPVFIHCHHGHHRGPAATALVCMDLAGWNADTAGQWLATAGTGTNYHGLFETVEQFTRPVEGQLESVSGSFPEAVKPEGIVESMIAIDRTVENLTQIVSSPQPDAPHLANESLLMLEYFREIRRLPETREKGEIFQDELDAMIERLERLRAAAMAGARPFVDSLRDLKKSCSSCHRHFRD